MWSLYVLIIASLVISTSDGSSETVADGTVADGTSGSSSDTVVTTSTGVTSSTTTTGSSSGSSSGAASSGSASSGTSGDTSSVTILDYDPCAGRTCGDVCNNCQLGEHCPSVVNRCDTNASCVSTTFECLAPSVDDTSGASTDASTDSSSSSSSPANNAPVAPVATRHPLVRIMCGMQSQMSCYGLSADLSAEADGVCGWSAQQRRCVVVSIGEEGKEGAMCQMHRTIAACNGGSMMGFGQQMVPPMMTEGIDNVCAWNPFTSSCKDGQLENEAGDGAGFGFASFNVCSGAVNPMSCPQPFCIWNAAGNGGVGGCVPGMGPNLKKEHPQKQESHSETEDRYLLAAVAGSAFIIGLGVTFVASRLFAAKSSFQEPLHLETV